MVIGLGGFLISLRNVNDSLTLLLRLTYSSNLSSIFVFVFEPLFVNSRTLSSFNYFSNLFIRSTLLPLPLFDDDWLTMKKSLYFDFYALFFFGVVIIDLI